MKMGKTKHPLYQLFLLFTIFLAAALPVIQGIKGSQVQISLHDDHHRSSAYKDGWKRMKIGSIAPICTYNECRGCKYKCRPHQVPIEANDPINTAYYYKCVCSHR